MTIIIGIASFIAIIVSFRWRTTVRTSTAIAVIMIFAMLQLLAFRINLIPYIATR